jgi:hypothetical protein
MEGLQEGEKKGEMAGQIKGLIGGFIEYGVLSQWSLRQIQKNSLPEALVEKIWDNCKEEQIIPENISVEGFIDLLRKADVLS